MAHTFHFTHYIYRGRAEREYPVEVSYSVSPFVPARLYGDYPQPEEGGEVELLDAKLIGDSYPITTEEWDGLLEACEARCNEDLAEAEADRGDYLYEQERDRRMMDRWNGSAAA